MRANLSTALAALTAPMTIRVNMLSHVFSSGSLQPFCAIHDFPGSLSLFAAINATGSLVYTHSTDGNDQVVATSSAAINTLAEIHDWLSIIFLIDNVDCRYYVEGVELGVAQPTGSAPFTGGSADYNLGADGNLSVIHPGSLGLVEVHGERKTPAWVAANWDQLPNILDPSLICAHDFRDGSPTDIGPNGDDVTILSGSATQEFPVLHFT